MKLSVCLSVCSSVSPSSNERNKRLPPSLLRGCCCCHCCCRAQCPHKKVQTLNALAFPRFTDFSFLLPNTVLNISLLFLNKQLKRECQYFLVQMKPNPQYGKYCGVQHIQIFSSVCVVVVLSFSLLFRVKNKGDFSSYQK